MSQIPGHDDAERRGASPVRHVSETEARKEVNAWNTGEAAVICDQAAQTIAAWFQTPAGHGAEFATLSTTGQCPPGLADACARELEDHAHDGPNRNALEALRAYANWNSEKGPA